MLPHRKKRLVLVLFLLGGVFLTLTLVVTALDNSLDFFYSPEAIQAGEAPVHRRIRAGGLVQAGSLSRQGLKINFVITDLQGHEVKVRFEGILPDLFREGQGIIAIGKLNGRGWLEATEVLAKHDENYMPPEAAAALETSASE